MNEGLRRWLLSVLVIGYWIAGFYPFRLDLPVYVENDVKRHPDSTLVFHGSGIARTSAPPDWLRNIAAASALRVDLTVRSHNAVRYGVARILTVSKDLYQRNLTIGQEDSDLVIRCRRPGSTLNGMPPFVVEGVFLDDAWHRIEVRFERAALIVLIDGTQKVKEPFVMRALTVWDPSYRVALGNELTGDRGWHGEIRKAVIYVGDRPRDYTEAVELPRGWWRVPPRLNHLTQFNLLPLSNTRDYLLNLLGFVPAGMAIFFAMGPRAALRRVLVLACSLSVSIEVGQVLFQDRYPSVTDIVLNTSGAAVGFLSARAYARLHA